MNSYENIFGLECQGVRAYQDGDELVIVAQFNDARGDMHHSASEFTCAELEALLSEC